MEQSNFYNNQVSFRLSDAVRERLIEVYPEIAGTDNLIAMKDFFTKVCETAIEAVILKQEVIVYQAEITALKSENKILADEKAYLSIELENAYKDFLLKLENYKKDVVELQNINNDLKLEKNSLIENLAGLTPSYNNDSEIIIELTEPEKAVMNEVTKRESERTKKQITPQIIFRDLFNTYMVKGASDVFPRIPDSDLARILQPFKK